MHCNEILNPTQADR